MTEKKSRKNLSVTAFMRRIATLLGWIVIWAILIGIALTLIGLGLWLMSLIDWEQLSKVVDAHLILEYVRTIIWPSVVVIVIIVFRGDIRLTIKRLIKASLPVGSVEFSPSQDLPDAEERAEIDNLNDAPVTTDAQVEEAAYNDPELRLTFERIYRNIFGTQFLALNFLMSAPSPLDASLLQQFYDRYFEQSPKTPTMYNSLHEYMQYLTSFGLVEYNATSNTYQILPAGKLFLRYMASQGLTADGKNL